MAAFMPLAAKKGNPNPQACDRVLKIMERMDGLLGIEPPKKIVHAAPTGQHPLPSQGVLAEEIRRINQELAALEREIQDEAAQQDTDNVSRKLNTRISKNGH